MTRGRWMAVMLVATFAAGSLVLRQPPLPQADLEAASTLPAQAVQIRHDLVVVPMPSPVKGTGSRSPRDARSLSASASSRSAMSGPREQTRRADAPLIAKVRRAVAGDGRYRPEPFPRVR